ncbi:MAG: helix-turn-helix domain-containing protein [Oscillospiraceae bacterium]|nr:helix-turn-helix domain-containing protein [Oscillospiraceae bacterium]
MIYPYVETGVRIFQLRKLRNLTREQLAEKADISVQFLYTIEIGKKNMTVTTLRKLASALCVTTDFIVNGNVGKVNSEQELIAIYKILSPENQNYALQILRTFAEAVK